jgi:hypothetical protein
MMEEIVIPFLEIPFMRRNGRKNRFYSPAFQIEIERIFGLTIRGSDYHFGLEGSKVSENQISLEWTVKVKIESVPRRAETLEICR